MEGKHGVWTKIQVKCAKFQLNHGSGPKNGVLADQARKHQLKPRLFHRSRGAFWVNSAVFHEIHAKSWFSRENLGCAWKKLEFNENHIKVGRSKTLKYYTFYNHLGEGISVFCWIPAEIPKFRENKRNSTIYAEIGELPPFSALRGGDRALAGRGRQYQLNLSIS